MIIGVGIDTVEISRFELWATKSMPELERIFSAQEISYCLQLPLKSAERFAVRFAAREALFKAVGDLYAIPFLTLCSATTIDAAPSGKPILHVNHPALQPELRYHISLSHTDTLATAIIIVEI